MSDEAENEGAPRVDGIWRPEEWKNGKFLVSRWVEGTDRPAKREVLSASQFSAFATIFESEESAEAAAKRLNEEQIAKIIEQSSSPEPQEKENNQ